MKTVATDSGRLVPPRDRNHLRHAREVVMERGIEARHLRQLDIKAQECINRSELAGQVVGVVRDDSAQLLEDFRSDELRAGESVAPMDDTMTDDGNILQTDDVSE